MAEYKRKDMPEDMIVRISPGRNTITVQECSANGVVSYREIDPIEFYFALNGSCISNVYQRSGFLPEHCLHISMNAEERHYGIRSCGRMLFTATPNTGASRSRG